MKDLIITINTNTRKAKTTKNFIGINGENLQGNIIFDFENEFIDGVGYLEIDNGEKYIIQMEKEAEHYTLPIKSSLLTKTGKLKIQLRVNINENQENMQVFKSEIIEIPVLEAINATSTIPDEYPGWVKARNINSEEATAGQVLTADGDGGASWQDAGAIDESFKVYFTTTLIGTLTDEEYAEMSVANVVNYNNAKYFCRYQEDETYLFFAFVDGYGIWKFGVNKTTKVLTYMITKVVASGLNSETATSGKVLTANGNGGASWEAIPAQTPEGTAIKSTGETSGKVLTADGQGGASWQNASGGTTLNKYTYSGSSVNISKLRNIIENSKGRIVGMLRTRAINPTAGIAETLVFLPANCIYTSGTIIRLEHEQMMTLSGTNRQYNVCCNIEITGNNSLNLHVYAYDYTNSTMVDCSESAYLNYVSITYWNDTQLH